METKEYLKTYANHSTKIYIYEQEIKAAQEMLKTLPEIPPQDITHRAENKLIKQLHKHIKECRQWQAEARQECEKIEAAINGVTDPRHRAILQMRYMQQPPETWERIAETLGYTFEHCHNLHRQALEKIKT